MKTERLRRNNKIYTLVSCVRKKDYFEALDIKSVTYNKMLWKTVAPLFSNKSKASNKNTLSENEKLIVNEQKCAEFFNNYFNSIVKELNILIDQNLLNDTSIFDDPIRDDTHMTSVKIVQFSRHTTPLVQLRPKYFHPLDLRRPVSNISSSLSRWWPIN